ncbi:MAG: hypothetical protein HQ495_05465 [Alphaproteobacteria bacterium]|nr:hypothetical protein [Alphaproteobacteria bacterium]
MLNGARRYVFVGFALALSGCGTAFSCGSEFGAPPERAFWCAPASDVGKFFEVPPPPPEPQASPVICTKTLGERDCVAAGS